MARMDSSVALLKEEIDKFVWLQDKHIKFGAKDTNPDTVFQELLWDAVHGEQTAVSRTRAFWDLTNEPGVGEAVNELTNQVERIIRMIRNLRISQLQEARTYLTEVCWRIV